MANIGKYEIVKELGKGASSTVYLGFDNLSKREVAIKLLNLDDVEETEAEQFRKFFLTEASLAGKLAHPHITAIHDAVISDEASYLVMEYVAGGTLERYCRVDNLLPHDKVIEIMFKCCHALNYAHRKGIIHRDIKPKNILVVEDTDIRISDFGAAFLKDDSTDTSADVNIGSLPYMSPQQAQGMELNQQVDIYALGVVLYKMLTGSLPFSASNDAGLLFQILNTEPPRPSHYRPDIPQSLDDIVMRAIAKDLAHRYRDWGEFERDLMAAADRLPKEAAVFRDTDKFNALLHLNFFRTFEEVELWEVVRISKWAYYPEGTVIIREGDETASFFIIICGQVEVRKNGRTVCTIDEGASFGEMSALRNNAQQRSASVLAHTDIRLIEISEDALRRASINCRHCFDREFLAILADRLAETSPREPIRERPGNKAAVIQPPPGASPSAETGDGGSLLVVKIAGLRLGPVALTLLAAYFALIHILLAASLK